MIAGKEMKMAKVEMTYWPIGYGRGVPATSGGDQGITVDMLNCEHAATAGEYADKTWDEYVTFNIIEELVKNRKTIQRKLDAARKRMKRLANRLNIIEKNWEGLPA